MHVQYSSGSFFGGAGVEICGVGVHQVCCAYVQRTVSVWSAGVSACVGLKSSGMKLGSFVLVLGLILEGEGGWKGDEILGFAPGVGP